jgi:hypothetical protein
MQCNSKEDPSIQTMREKRFWATKKEMIMLKLEQATSLIHKVEEGDK